MAPSVLRVALFVALLVAGVGVVGRIVRWFRRDVGPDASAVPPRARVGAALRPLAGRQLPATLRAFVVDGLFQRRLLAADATAWGAHLALALGFTLLLGFHALDEVITAKLSSEYASTAAPWLFLRDLVGLVVAAAGVVLLVRRRRRSPARHRSDLVLWSLMTILLISGFSLQATKTLSAPTFYAMTEEYLGTSDPEDEDVAALARHWGAELGVVFEPPLPEPGDGAEEAAAYGAELHGEACAGCHARPSSAFVSWALSRALAPAAGPLARHRVDVTLLVVHVFAALALLAWLPWGRLFHVLADPVSVATAGGAARAGAGTPALRVARRALALDACVQCGVCDARCSVRGLAMDGDRGPLPSVKLRAASAALAARGATPERALLGLAADHATCTDCHRCTDACPAGIDLADLWDALRAQLGASGFPAPASWVKATPASTWADRVTASRGRPGAPTVRGGRGGGLSGRAETFMPCVQCQTCTNVCPVVAHAGGGEGAVDLTPQKVMNLLRLGLRDWAVGARMTWDCATCYQCQESCPEGIPVTDVLYELRQLGWRRLRSLPPGDPRPDGSAARLPALPEEGA